ncbi:hypothetical protein DYB32_006134, partial [Aphanomyces invadans]
MAGFADLVHLDHLDVPGRYLVVRTAWHGLPVYIHNLYAPTESHLRCEFFQGLPRAFEDDSLHLIGGDFNLPIDPALDTVNLHPRPVSGRSDCIEWLTDLRVIDAWRLRHPQERSYSGPGRINRLDYIFVDHDLATQLSSVASYNANVHGGDHLSHTLMLSNNMPPPSKGYWRLPRELLDDPTVVTAIQEEAATFLDEMNSNPDRNHGAMWYGWLKRIKSQLVKCHRQHLQAGKANLEYLHLRVVAAKRAFERSGYGAEEVVATRLAYASAREEFAHVCRDKQFDFHASSNERGTSHFFRRPCGSKVPITSATVDGVVVTDVRAVHDAFTQHWKHIMSAPTGGPPINRERRRAVVRTLSKRLSREDRATLDEPLTAAELHVALKTMDPAKSPGPDGWSAGFFQVAPAVFAEILLK